MSKGMLKSYFPGGNTSQGFFSLYHHMISQDATRIFVIKGGPGVGKSTFMRSIGETMLDKGYDVEFHCCSSDNGSLDGVVIPALKIAMVDGTAPHIVDPKNPGAVDEIIHLGDYWNETLMRSNKEAVLQSNARVGRLFRIAYSSLKEAKAIIEEWESYITEAQCFAKVNQVTQDVLEQVFAGVKPQFEQTRPGRHLFASAITPKGPETHWSTILQGVTRLFAIKGLPGSGKSTLIETIAKRAEQLGLFTQVFHRPLDPSKLDGVVIPDLQAAVINADLPFTFEPAKVAGLQVVLSCDLSDFLNPGVLQTYSEEIADATQRFRSAFNRATEYLRLAKAEHDVMETYYIPAMDFAAINRKREEILQRILNYAEEME
ncbi:MAG TPA: PRK06851 family protein [Bacillota bacterium]|nr:PRK06851 family protein [Bacillota bacterium]